MLTDTLTSLVEPLLAGFGLELVEGQFRREAGGWTLRLIIYKEGGVTLDDCSKVSREVGNLLDVEDLIDHPYRLEVSSPGLDRPLKTERDFRRYSGKPVKITMKESSGNQQVLVGIIDHIESGMLSLATEQGVVEVPLTGIAKARLEINF